MKVATLFLVLPALLSGVLAAPAASQEVAVEDREAFPQLEVEAREAVSEGVALERRQEASGVNLITYLTGSIKQFTAVINDTASGLSASPTDEETAAANDIFITNINNITTAVNDVIVYTLKLSPESTLLRRQNATNSTTDPLAEEIAELLEELSGSLNMIVNTLGLGGLLGTLGPLVSSLSVLLLTLEPVVDNLLALVDRLLDGLLTGLSIGLNGLIVG